jgi:hypothetical protein
MQSIAEENELSIRQKVSKPLIWGASEEHTEMEKVRRKLIEFEQKRMYKNEELTNLVRKKTRMSLHTAYEIRTFNKRYRRTNSGRQVDRFGRVADAGCPGANPASATAAEPIQRSGARRPGKLKRMQGRNFIVTFFANVIFIPKQLVCGIFSLAAGSLGFPRAANAAIDM